jgi:hypothetical protein
VFDRPVIILAAPRSGSTLLFETLAESPDAWTIGGESHQIIESVPALSPNSGAVLDNRLIAEHATAEIVALLRRRFTRFLRDRDGRDYARHRAPQPVRFLEKTPKNALRLPFLDAVFPDARYIFLFRDVRANLSSMIEAWRSGRWVTYPRLPGWQGPPWSLLLPPGWSALNGQSIERICAFQWASANRTLLSDLQRLPRERWTTVSYEDLTDDPAAAVERLCAFTGFAIDDRMRQRLGNPLPLSRLTQTRPDPDKWRRNEREIANVLDSLEDVETELEMLGYRRRG